MNWVLKRMRPSHNPRISGTSITSSRCIIIRARCDESNPTPAAAGHAANNRDHKAQPLRPGAVVDRLDVVLLDGHQLNQPTDILRFVADDYGAIPSEPHGS